MNICFFEIFVWLVCLCNFWFMVEWLYIMQVVVFSCIVLFEQDFGVCLFDCSVCEVVLIVDGSKVLVYVECMVKFMCEMKDDMFDCEVFVGVICIGVIEFIVYSWFLDFFGCLYKVFLCLQIEIVSDIIIYLYEQFSKSNLDLVLQVELVIGLQVSNIVLCEFFMCWVGSFKFDIGSEMFLLMDLVVFFIISFVCNLGLYVVIECLFLGSEWGECILYINCIVLVVIMICLVMDGFGIMVVLLVIIQCEFNEESLYLLCVDIEFLVLVLIVCFCVDYENLLIEIVVCIVQEMVFDFVFNWGYEIVWLFVLFG